MRKRVDRVFGEHTDRARLCTFHEFAADILGQHGSHLGIRPDFQLITQDEDRVAILEEVIAELPGSGRRLPADRNNLLHLVDRLFTESYGGEGRSPSLTSTPAWLPPLFRRYCDALAGDHRLDDCSLLFFANRLLREKPAVARVVRLGWTHICVDGFQDTNRSQYDLLRLIAPGRRHNLCVVGDDDRSATGGTGRVRTGFGICAETTSWRRFGCPRAIAAHPRSWITPIDCSRMTWGRSRPRRRFRSANHGFRTTVSCVTGSSAPSRRRRSSWRTTFGSGDSRPAIVGGLVAGGGVGVVGWGGSGRIDRR